MKKTAADVLVETLMRWNVGVVWTNGAIYELARASPRRRSVGRVTH